MSKLAVIGAGLVGERHTRLAAARGVLSCLIDPVDRGALAEELGVAHHPALTPGLQDGIEAAIVATPNHTHADVAVPLLEAGIPCLIEKPIAATRADAERIVAAQKASGTPCLVGYHRRHNPITQRAKEVIASGRLGRLTVVDAKFWLVKPDDYFDEAWRRESGAGPVFINLTHDIDLLRHLVGDIAAVHAAQSHAVRKYEVEDCAAILLRFAHGALGTVTVSDATPAPFSWEFTAGENPAYPHVAGAAYAIGGTKATLTLPDLTLWHHPGAQSWWAPISKENLALEPADALAVQFNHFLDGVAGRAAPAVTGEDGLASRAAVLAIKDAAEIAPLPVPG